jgi:hypothetical protein
MRHSALDRVKIALFHTKYMSISPLLQGPESKNLRSRKYKHLEWFQSARSNRSLRGSFYRRLTLLQKLWNTCPGYSRHTKRPDFEKRISLLDRACMMLLRQILKSSLPGNFYMLTVQSLQQLMNMFPLHKVCIRMPHSS